MTIAIAAAGKRAGLAVFTALRAAERAGAGSIGGFATFAALDADGAVHRFETQRGGGATLFTDGETTGTPPPAVVADAVAAGVISSGPDRPVPLSQFVTAAAGVGLVTGHRLPQSTGADGRPLNAAVLDNLQAGMAPDAAVAAVLEANPEADAGLIAVDMQGRVGGRNTARVARRHDLGHERREAPGAIVETLQNSIQPFPSIAALACESGLDAMRDPPVVAGSVTIEAGMTIVLGSKAAIEADAAGIATRLVTTDPLVAKGRHIAAPLQTGSPVRIGGRTVGYSLVEPITDLDDGRIVSLIGKQTARIDYTKDPLPGAG